MWVILSLIIAVAAFNIISMLVMVVTDKQPDIAILKTMGARDGTIMRVFMIQGSVIGVVGTLLGVVGGILLALNIGAVVPFLEQLFGFSLFPADIYYITELPSDLQAADVLISLLELPSWVGRAVLLLLVIGFGIAVLLSWIYELTPEGVKLEFSGREFVTGTAKALENRF